MLLITLQFWQFLSVMNTHFFYRFFRYFRWFDLAQRFVTFFYLSSPFGHALAVQHPLTLAKTWLL